MFKLARLVFESLESKVGVKVYFSGSCVNNNHYKTSCNRIPFLQNNSNEFKIIWNGLLAFFFSEKTLITSSPKSSLSTLSCWTGLQVIFHHQEKKNCEHHFCSLPPKCIIQTKQHIHERKKKDKYFFCSLDLQKTSAANEKTVSICCLKVTITLAAKCCVASFPALSTLFFHTTDSFKMHFYHCSHHVCRWWL